MEWVVGAQATKSPPPLPNLLLVSVCSSQWNGWLEPRLRSPPHLSQTSSWSPSAPVNGMGGWSPGYEVPPTSPKPPLGLRLLQSMEWVVGAQATKSPPPLPNPLLVSVCSSQWNGWLEPRLRSPPHLSQTPSW